MSERKPTLENVQRLREALERVKRDMDSAFRVDVPVGTRVRCQSGQRALDAEIVGYKPGHAIVRSLRTGREHAFSFGSIVEILPDDETRGG